MKRLIVTADDFGMTDGVSSGIVDAMAHGVVSSASAMVGIPGGPERLARHYSPALAGRVGLHLQLTAGRACAPPAAIPALVDVAGRFPRRRGDHPLPGDEIAREWRAQADRLRAAGITPAHLDSHHHVHHAPDACAPFAALAASLGVPGRSGPAAVRNVLAAAGVPQADRFEGGWFGGVLTVERFLAIVERAFAAIGGDGTVELMCHPGRSDRELEALSSYASERDRELAVLCDPVLPRRLADLGITTMPAGALGS
jgi:predicted glycoside hydrolase/deacetylase ChbG (UPF0249 family)